MKPSTNYESQPRASFPHASGLHPIKLLLDILGLPVVLGVGSLVQLLASQVGLWYLPAILLIGAPLLRNVLVYLGIVENAYLKNIVPGRTTGSFPSTYARGEADPEYAVLHLGTRSNSPLGMLDPTMQVVAGNFVKMMSHLNANPTENGFLNAETYLAAKRASSNTLLIVFYFRSHDEIMKFAHGPHMAGWREYAKLNAQKALPIELWHEVFVVSRSENVYVNSEPIGMGNLWMKDEGAEKGTEARWINGLHSVGKSSTAKQRMG